MHNAELAADGQTQSGQLPTTQMVTMVGLLVFFCPGNMLPSEEMLADADFA
jgi:hypothetical protein